ncbi:hypothetical protein ACIBF1_44270 [Spirillospora sp. NPDC050679]
MTTSAPDHGAALPVLPSPYGMTHLPSAPAAGATWAVPGPPPASPVAPPAPGGPLHTTVVAVDIAGFGAPDRDDDAQRYLRSTMYTLVAAAFARSQLPWEACIREDRGDGILIITPPGLPPAAFLDLLAHHLTALLRRANRLANPTGRLRLRVAVHAGHIHRDAHGLVGRPLIHLFRLLEAAAIKKAFATADHADLILIVDETFYRTAVDTSSLIDRAAYKPLRIIAKETRTPARIWLPPHPT